MSVKFILVQLIAFVAFLFLISSYKEKRKKGILFKQFISGLFYSLHYALLGARSGFVNSIIISIRNITFSKVRKNQKKLSKIFIALFIIMGIITFKEWYSIIPIIGASIYTYNMSGTKKRVLQGGLINAGSWAIYNILAGSYVGALAESLVFLANFKALYIKKKEK